MGKVTLEIHPPLSNKLSSTKKTLVLEEEINQGERLGDLLERLASKNCNAWAIIFDVKTHQISHQVLTILNTKTLTSPERAETRLSNGDRMVFLTPHAGG